MPPVYGTKGVANALNTPGGMASGLNWTDNNGNLWLFGSVLWKFNISSNQWTWMAGSNINQKGVYGVKGIPSASNTPGFRSCGANWKDNSGNLWLFGGSGYATANFGPLNDLWKYDVSSNQWTWINGDSVVKKNGVYGAKAVTSNLNKPGSRGCVYHWKDLLGNFWLLGGNGYPASGNTTLSLNDLWKYDLGSNQWTWDAGDSIGDFNGNYGTQGIASPFNFQGTRNNGNPMSSDSWTDNSGNLWLFGGLGFPAFGASGRMNDLWKIDISGVTKINEATSKAKSNFNLYPNPSNGLFTLQLNSASQISISNTLGQEIFNETKPEGKHIIDLKNEANGIYFVKVNSAESNSTMKIVKE